MISDTLRLQTDAFMGPQSLVATAAELIMMIIIVAQHLLTKAVPIILVLSEFFSDQND